MMKNKNRQLAEILVDLINDLPFLESRLIPDFSDTSKIEVRSLVSLTVPVCEFVFYHLSLLEMFHLKLVSTNDTISIWEFV